MLKSPSVLKEVNAFVGSQRRTRRQHCRRARDIASGSIPLKART